MEEEIPKESFSSFYAREIEPELPEIDKLRKEAQGKMALPLIIVFGSVAGLLAMNPIVGIQALLIVAIGLFSLYGLYRRYKRQVTRDYRMEFKNKVMRKIVKYIDPKHRYSGYGRLKKTDFISCGIWNMNPDRYVGDDLVSGVHDQTAFSFSEIYVQTYIKDHKRRRRLTPLFKGLLFKADFNKNFKHQTVVLPDVSERFLGNVVGKFVQKINPTRDEQVNLENPEFEKYFSVYSSDQQEARYILSPKLMERVLKYQENHKMPLYLSFSNSHVYLAIPRIKDWFEPELFKTINNYELIESYYTDMSLAIQIIDDLDLNTRIWSKQPVPEKESPKKKSNRRGGRRGGFGWR